MKPLDDYFNKNGKYLGSDEAKTDIVRVVNQEDWDANKTVSENGTETISNEKGVGISTTFSEAGMNEDASLAVYDHYNDTGLPAVLDDLDGSGAASFRYTVEGEEKLVFDDEQLKKTKVSDHANEIKSVIVHENQHFSDYKSMGRANYMEAGKTNFGAQGKERRAVNTQVNDATFSKTRPVFQKAVLNYGRKNGYIPMPKIKRIGL
jgi:hypothetical protein